MTDADSILEVYADIACPFAYVGLRRLITARADAQRYDVPIEVQPWPLELVNGTPLNPQTTATHVAELRDQIAPELFSGFDPANFPNTTLPALALVHVANQLDPAIGLAVDQALRTALFEHGLDVSDPAVLHAIAYEYALPEPTPADAAAVQALYQTGRTRSVQGSPHFFYRDYAAFCPSLAISADPGPGLTIAFDTSALDELVTYCFPRSQPTPSRSELLALLRPRIDHLATCIGTEVLAVTDTASDSVQISVSYAPEQLGVLSLLRLGRYLQELFPFPLTVATPEIAAPTV
jgi:predicted DsbA family dithiol-disulfide isomerase